MGLSIPEEYGGFGASAKVYNRVFGEIGGTDPALCVYFGAHQSIGCKGITLFGTEEQKQRYLPRCASGELVAGFCLTEPGSGSDAQAMKTTAVLSDDGTHYLLSGTKIWISNAGYADLFTVFAKVAVEVDGKQKAARHRVHRRRARAGRLARQARREDGHQGVRHARRLLRQRERAGRRSARRRRPGLPHRARGPQLRPARVSRRRRRAERGTSCNEALAYAKQREQFGRPIGSFEMIQRKIATNAAECYAADSAVMVAAGMVDRGGIDFSLETAACKVFASELAFRAANDALQIAGGIGYSKEYPYEQAVRDSRINLIFEGTNEILRALIALMGLQQPGERLKALGKAFKDPIHSLGAIGHYHRRPREAHDHEAVIHARASGARARSGSRRDAGARPRARRRGRAHEARQGDRREAVPPGAHRQRRDRHLPRDGRALAHDVGDRARRRRRRLPQASARLRAHLRADGVSPRAPVTSAPCARHQDARLKAIAERSMETGELGPEAPADER